MQALEGQVGSRRAIRFLGFEEISAHVEEGSGTCRINEAIGR